MNFREIHLRNFRNFNSTHLALGSRLNFLVGDNGQGKTNFLEAIHLLCRGDSFRFAERKTLISDYGRNTDAGQISAVIEKENLSYDVEMWIDSQKKSILVNGKSSSSWRLVELFPVVVFSPESLSAIKDGPEQRRLLVDELVLTSRYPGQASVVREFGRCLRARNKILRELSEDGGSASTNSLRTLESLNSIFLVLGTQLTVARLESIRRLHPHLAEAWGLMHEGNTNISVDYLISDKSVLNYTEQDIYSALHNRLQELARTERSLGTSLVGPHKHEVRFLFAGNDSRFFCSQGQQRALIIAFKTAQIVYHQQVHQTFPILLLDDVMSELDKQRRESLMKFLEGISAQVLITSTDLTWSEWFNSDHNRVFSVFAGRIRAHSD